MLLFTYAVCCAVLLPCCCSVEEQQLQDKMQAEHHEEGFDMDEASHRLNEIYERMQEVSHAGVNNPKHQILAGWLHLGAAAS
jgi:hypothetical protein